MVGMGGAAGVLLSWARRGLVGYMCFGLRATFWTHWANQPSACGFWSSSVCSGLWVGGRHYAKALIMSSTSFFALFNTSY
jgi:hypothetical protein